MTTPQKGVLKKVLSKPVRVIEPVNVSAGVTAVLPEGRYLAVPLEIVDVEELAVLVGVRGGADDGEAGGGRAAADATAAAALAGLRAAEHLVRRGAHQRPPGYAATAAC